MRALLSTLQQSSSIYPSSSTALDSFSRPFQLSVRVLWSLSSNDQCESLLVRSRKQGWLLHSWHLLDQLFSCDVVEIRPCRRLAKPESWPSAENPVVRDCKSSSWFLARSIFSSWFLRCPSKSFSSFSIAVLVSFKVLTTCGIKYHDTLEE